MFGPDQCGSTKRIHVILAYKGKNVLMQSGLEIEIDEEQMLDGSFRYEPERTTKGKAEHGRRIGGEKLALCNVDEAQQQLLLAQLG